MCVCISSANSVVYLSFPSLLLQDALVVIVAIVAPVVVVVVAVVVIVA